MSEVVTATVEAYPFDGVTGIVIEAETSYGWVEVLDSSSIGTFPNYTTAYAVTLTGNWPLRYRWITGGTFTKWLSPISKAIATNDFIEARLTQAVVAKAARIYAMSQAPLGTHGEMTEYGAARVMPDYQIGELLAGLLRVNWDVNLDELMGSDDSDDPYGSGVDKVVDALGYDSVPAGKEADLVRAIESAVSWVSDHILGAVPV